MSAAGKNPRQKSPVPPPAVVFFASAAEFRRWLEKNHATTRELQVGFYKKSSGRGGLSYPEAVDEALCFGWIDGILRKLDDERYTHRFTPRRPGSIWSNVNVGHVERLRAAGRMHAAGLAAFAARSAAKTGIYSFEQGTQILPSAYEKQFRAHARAWSAAGLPEASPPPSTPRWPACSSRWS